MNFQFESQPANVALSKVHVFGRHKISQPKPTKVLLFIHSHRNFPEQALNMQTKTKKFQMPALRDHLQLHFCISKIKIIFFFFKKKVNIAHFKSCWRRNFLLQLLMSKCETFLPLPGPNRETRSLHELTPCFST